MRKKAAIFVDILVCYNQSIKMIFGIGRLQKTGSIQEKEKKHANNL